MQGVADKLPGQKDWTLQKFKLRRDNLKKSNQRFFNRLEKWVSGGGASRSKNLDAIFAGLHDEVFEQTDCLACANCCKTTSPVFKSRDIERISRSISMRPAVFSSTYLRTDEEGDEVLCQAPCPFLNSDNYCSIYSDRPNACKGYPHTDKRQMAGMLKLTQNNTRVCPAVLEIIERLKPMLSI